MTAAALILVSFPSVEKEALSAYGSLPWFTCIASNPLLPFFVAPGRLLGLLYPVPNLPPTGSVRRRARRLSYRRKTGHAIGQTGHGATYSTTSSVK